MNWKSGVSQNDLKRLEGSMTKFTKFLSDDAGAVTIDWVALTAGILLLGIIVVYTIFNGGVASLVSSINSTLESVTTNVTVPTLTIGQ
jgi:Flp pilus assembly pilin Flp